MSGQMKPFRNVENAHPGYSIHDLSYQKLFTCDMGQLIPVCHDEVIPGDHWKIGAEVVVRFNPLVFPVLHSIDCIVEYYFVPTRLLWDDWEDFMTLPPESEDYPVLPVWDPDTNGNYGVGTLWDFFGFPLSINPGLGYQPIDFIRRAYFLVWNEYFRDENLQTEIDITDPSTTNKPLNVAWAPDYFSKSLPWQQKGVAPALPITGSTSAVWSSDVDVSMDVNPSNILPNYVYVNPVSSDGLFNAPAGGTSLNQVRVSQTDINNNVVDLSTATTFNIADLRLAFQIQKFLERDARCGTRYTEWLKGHYNQNNGDSRLQRPEFIGGSINPVIVSEVLQTSETDTTPQGNMAGHGIAVGSSFCGKYHATEFGYIIGLMRIVPKPMYSQGINRQWLRQSKYDFPIPEFVSLSEQAITQEEIYAVAGPQNATIFGFQGRYDECRYKPNMVCGLMRPEAPDNLADWHLSRYFTAQPFLNDAFIECVPDKRIFAVEDQPGLIVAFGNLIHCVRPIPILGTPGLIDHH